MVTLIGMNINWIDTDNQTVGSLSSYTGVQAAGSPVSMKVIVSGTGGDVTKNSYIRNNIPNTSITNQVVSLAKSGTPMVVFGNGSGPRVLIVAGVHGNELPSQIAAMKLINYLNGKQIRGTVYIVPFVAPSITAKNIRYWNGKNLNRVTNVAGTPTNKILNLAKQLKIMALGDFHSTRPGGVPGKKSVFCSKSPCPTSYKIAYNISKQTGSALIAYPKCGIEYAGALEDCTNLAGIPSVTCEVVSPHGTVASGSVSGSYYQMLTLLRYKTMI
ncbi:succinylglutamate desuccinylase/aspartoacylase family protein [Methanobacterium oryzae]|uniref:succinylglutamate desuccinylase/aspartoacylase family protein n=1 Tax=Methanobacterium oryzae TaxID=69540 RepID=UPI003D24F869